MIIIFLPAERKVILGPDWYPKLVVWTIRSLCREIWNSKKLQKLHFSHILHYIEIALNLVSKLKIRSRVTFLVPHSVLFIIETYRFLWKIHMIITKVLGICYVQKRFLKIIQSTWKSHRWFLKTLFFKATNGHCAEI